MDENNIKIFDDYLEGEAEWENKRKLMSHNPNYSLMIQFLIYITRIVHLITACFTCSLVVLHFFYGNKI